MVGGQTQNINGKTAVTSFLNTNVDVFSLSATANLPTATAESNGIAGPTAGYILGGTTGANASGTGNGLVLSSYKINYATVALSANPSSNLITAQIDNASTQSSTAGYVVGGFTNTSTAIGRLVSKIPFSTEVVGASTALPVPLVWALGGAASSIASYFAGGTTTNSLVWTDAVWKINFSNDSATNSLASLPSALGQAVAAGSSTTGYFMGGLSSSFLTTVSRISYSNEIVSANTGNLLVATIIGGAIQSPSAIYFCGGWTGAPTSAAYKMPFATETFSASFGNLDQAKYSSGNVSYNPPVLPTTSTTTTTTSAPSATNGGYMFGGFSASSIINTAQTLNYNTEVVLAVSSAALPVATAALSGFANSTNAYMSGPHTGATVNLSYKMPFATQVTVAAPSSNLVTGAFYVGSAQSSTDGYVVGGYTGSPSSRSAILQKMPFSTGVFALGTNLPNQYSDLMNSASDGLNAYWGGGYTGTSASSILKLTYSTGLSSLLTGLSSLSVATYSTISGQSSTIAYFFGGEQTSGVLSNKIYQMDFATNQTKVNANSTLLDPITRGLTVTSASAIYYCGGYTTNTPATAATSVVFKTPFATDICSVCITADLAIPSANGASVSYNPTA